MMMKDQGLWVLQHLRSQGYHIEDEGEDVQITPWSKVKRFTTSHGNVYLKQTTPALAIEPDVIELLHHHTNHIPV